ncbi:Sir2 family NAD-dependent protein deacetylase [Ruicaihuangia caeni]|uniref:protein acetyllysine N-acetyltransferase n=1 Tax=Ruicaihuangia caeni TaxID=3042517 RepID=A0AAW6T4Y7_9MICO|nr:Sir2 family NAD-dependent protein deacetylase [Klugiella sp. YN-L-19]MDI2098161.1 Sir2 family NAD-dependent protein deacetylase [Klugiella sp. YN-L-19]
MRHHAHAPGLDASLGAQADAAADLLAGHLVAVLTGAGLSTDSGIPDYRGEGAPKRAPMTWQTFSGSENAQRRYWAGGHLGWRRFAAAQPNGGHRALAELEHEGVTNGVITQNVDGLHVRAGSKRVVALHGSGDRVRCLAHGHELPRAEIEAQIGRSNPWLDAMSTDAALNPDGDAEVAAYDRLVLPRCPVCGAAIRPDVVFFGELVPAERFAKAAAMVEEASALLVAGSSLVVNSGIRIVERARREHKPIVIINRGITRADGRSVLKLDAGTSELLSAIRDRLRR